MDGRTSIPLGGKFNSTQYCITSFSPLVKYKCFLGLLPREECSKPVCLSTQEPKVDNCHLDDGYSRLFLYRSWKTSCNPMQNDLSRTFTYLWDYHGSWHWGVLILLRCLPGYVIPDAHKTVSFQTLNTNDILILKYHSSLNQIFFCS